MSNKVKIIALLIAVVVVIALCLSTCGYRYASAGAIESKVKNEILKWNYDKHIRGEFWDRTVRIKVTRVSVNLLDDNKIGIKNCKFDIYWKEGRLEYRWKPVISGEAKLVQYGTRLYAENIYFNEADLTGNKLLNDLIMTIVNPIMGSQRIEVYENEKLANVKIRTSSWGVFARPDL